MRILITTDVAGGVWSYTEELVDALLGRGHAVALAVFGGEPGSGHRAWLAGHRELPLAVLPYPLEWLPEPEPGLGESVGELRRVVADFGADVVHLNQYYYGAFELGAPRLVAAHSDVVSWWRTVKGEEPPDDPWFRRYRAWIASGLQGAHVRVAPSAWIAAQVEEIYGVGPIRAVHNARAPERWEERPPAGARVRRRGPRGPLVVAAGRLWDEAKGVRDLIPAAARLRGAARVVVAGPTRHPAGGQDFPAEAPGIEWAGILCARELRLLLSQAQVYAATSHYEPFGLAPLEAALAGCALVMADIPTYRELWDDCALFYPTGDAEALAAATLELLGDGGLRRMLAAAARARARARYTPTRMAEEYERLYHEAVQVSLETTATE